MIHSIANLEGKLMIICAYQPLTVDPVLVRIFLQHHCNSNREDNNTNIGYEARNQQACNKEECEIRWLDNNIERETRSMQAPPNSEPCPPGSCW